ncbi:Hypothetical predicted protein, partial [Paramuricea clavata]
LSNPVIVSLIKWAHDMAGVPNPMGNKFLQNVAEGAKREHAKPVSKKTPITSKVLEECCMLEHCYCFLGFLGQVVQLRQPTLKFPTDVGNGMVDGSPKRPKTVM